MTLDKPINGWSVTVAGDTVIDHHIYLGERFAPNDKRLRPLRDFWEPGGAVVLYDLLLKATSQAGYAGWKVHLATQKPDLHRERFSQNQHAFAIWKPHSQSEEKKDQVWRAQEEVSYGQTEAAHPTNANDSRTALAAQDPVSVEDLPESNILVLDDAGLGFWELDRERLLNRLRSNKLQWIVLKMSDRVEQAPLWKDLSARFPERLVCLVSAYKLRGRYLNIARGLSWQRAVKDLREEWSKKNEVLADLRQSQHLIISFSADGALWLDLSDKGKPKASLVFDPMGAEGEWIAKREGEVPRYSVNMAAAVTLGLAAHCRSPDRPIDLVPSIKRGLGALRRLVDVGHGNLSSNEHPRGFPTDDLASYITASETSDEYEYARAFSHMELPWPTRIKTSVTSARPWTIVEALERSVSETSDARLMEIALQIIASGVESLSEIPHARFRKLYTVDRIEIETLRSLWRRMRDYKKEDQPKPLSIGVFGPPGAGKSFGVEQIVHEVFGSEAWLNFNLSQFDGPKDLIGAFHQVRDKALSGKTPVAFWDEFDSMSHIWLKYFLAPMQDGRFQEGQLSHWIGKCVFVFAGGTSHTFSTFGIKEKETPTPEETLRMQQFKLNKVPDFLSRLDGYYDVKGPNPTGEIVDARSLLQRALMIRAILCKGDDSLSISFDPGLLNALLRIPHYTHGARSLQKIAAQLRSRHGRSIHRSDLPSPAFLGMHVDMPRFTSLLNEQIPDS